LELKIEKRKKVQLVVRTGNRRSFGTITALQGCKASCHWKMNMNAVGMKDLTRTLIGNLKAAALVINQLKKYAPILIKRAICCDG
jgi:hypothetical protein